MGNRFLKNLKHSLKTDPLHQSLIRGKVFENDPVFRKLRMMREKRKLRDELSDSLKRKTWTKKEMKHHQKEFFENLNKTEQNARNKVELQVLQEKSYIINLEAQLKNAPASEKEHLRDELATQQYFLQKSQNQLSDLKKVQKFYNKVLPKPKR